MDATKGVIDALHSFGLVDRKNEQSIGFGD
jgi:hypothetical protein